MNYKNIKVEKRENYAIIEIANNKNNSLDQKTLNEIGDATKNLNKSKEIKCIGLIGGPKFFSPGADIKELEKLDSKKAKKQKLFSKVDDLQKIDIPIISFVEGYALGGGFELALSSDLIIASSEAKFGLPEINLGLIPGGGGTQRLTHLVGYGKSLELILSGEFINAQEAYTFGLINHIYSHDEIEEKTNELARIIGSKSSHTLRIAKNAVRAALNSPIDEGIQKELRVFSDLFDTEDKEIGVNAFLEKKTPIWKGR